MNNTLKWLYDVPGRKKAYIVLLTALQGISGLTGILYALFMKNIVDSAAGRDPDGFARNIVYILILTAVQIFLGMLIRRFYEQARAEIENIFKKRLTDNILNRDYPAISAVHSGAWLNRLTSDTAIAANGYVEIIPGIAGTLIRLVSALAMLIVLDVRFAYIFIPGGIAAGVMTYLFRKILKKLHKNVQESDGRLRIFLQERISSLLMIRSFAAEKATSEYAGEKMNAHKNARMDRNRFSNICSAGFSAGMQGMYLIGVCYCASGIISGKVSFGTLTAVMQLISQVQSPIANITGYLPRIYTMTASAERLMEIEFFAESGGKALEIPDILTFYRDSLVSFGLHNAGFTYYPSVEKVSELSKENMPPAVNNISFEIKKGEYAAFVGHSGCGKSTAAKLLMGIYPPDSGECYIRRTNGREENLSSEYRRLFAYVPQGNHLMNGTIREIVSFADNSRSGNDEEIMLALKTACADGFVNELENGIDTVLGEDGEGLSEGQMQRIAAARAIFSESPVLILDEATSSLDEKTEQRLLENLRRLTDKTVVFITHRTAALNICDKVFEFTDNGVVENGKA